MRVALRILIFLAMTCSADLNGIQAQSLSHAPPPKIRLSDGLPLSFTAMEDSAPIPLANEVESWDDDDFKNDLRSASYAYVPFRIGMSRRQVSVDWQTSTISSQVAKHPRIYELCSLQI